jgi:FdhE protein
VAPSPDEAWALRIARARELAAECPPAAEILSFYAGLAACQRTICTRVKTPHHETGSFDEALDLDAASRAVPILLSWLQNEAPHRLAALAADAASFDPATWRELMKRFVSPADNDDLDASLGFIVEAVLQPFAEVAARWKPLDAILRVVGARINRCPVCGSLPAVGVLREEGHGARRTLVCSLCFTEWPYQRVVCPSCDETRFDALPIYTAEGLESVRIDACDSCHVYLKTIDLTKDALAEPLVDDLATLSLDLWARERGYRRVRPNLLRI